MISFSKILSVICYGTLGLVADVNAKLISSNKIWIYKIIFLKAISKFLTI